MDEFKAPQARENRALHRFAVLTAAAAVVLLAAGATVTSTGSGDAVPDWPLSYGTLLPRMVGGVLYEHTHRILAAITALLVAALALWLRLKEKRRSVRVAGAVLLAAVLVQALLGGMRVLVVSNPTVQQLALRLTAAEHANTVRMSIAIIHAFWAQVVLCLAFAIAAVTSRDWLLSKAERGGQVRPRRFSIAVVSIIFAQLLLGALVRHLEAGLAIPDFPLSFGRIVPPFADLNSDELRLKVLVNFMHRAGALAVALSLFALTIHLFRRYRSHNKLMGLSGLLLGLAAIQMSLGALIVWTGKAVPITVAHVTVGALLLGSSTVLALWVWRLEPLPRAEQREAEYAAGLAAGSGAEAQ